MPADANRKRRPVNSSGHGEDTIEVRVGDLLAFVEQKGMVLESAHHPSVPNLVEHIVGERIRGSWWGHPEGQKLYALLNALREADDQVAVCRFIEGKITYIHVRLWAPCARLATVLGPERLDLIHSVHTDRGHHRTERIPLDQWLPREVAAEAAELSQDEAHALLEEWNAD